jgi:hypothetical protein
MSSRSCIQLSVRLATGTWEEGASLLGALARLVALGDAPSLVWDGVLDLAPIEGVLGCLLGGSLAWRRLHSTLYLVQFPHGLSSSHFTRLALHWAHPFRDFFDPRRAISRFSRYTRRRIGVSKNSLGSASSNASASANGWCAGDRIWSNDRSHLKRV